jgi:hypothetical protein
VARDDAQAARASRIPFVFVRACERLLTTRAHCQNRCHGLGFKVPWLGVIDKKSMAAYAATLYTALGSVVTALLAFEAEQLDASAADNECALSSAQAGSIQATVAPWRNSSCVYNMTIEAALGMA